MAATWLATSNVFQCTVVLHKNKMWQQKRGWTTVNSPIALYNINRLALLNPYKRELFLSGSQYEALQIPPAV